MTDIRLLYREISTQSSIRKLMMNTKYLPFSFLILVSIVVQACGQTAGFPRKAAAQDAQIKQSEGEAEKEKQRRREMEIQNLVLTAKIQSVEFASDILFGVLEAKLIRDPKKKRDIIEEVFRRGSEAREPLKIIGRGELMDTRSGYRWLASDLRLDRLSLQLRAVKLMLAIDKQKARELFSEIPQIKLPPLSCKDDFDYEISEFYVVLKDIVEQTFDAEAIQRKEQIYFASSYIETVDSASQIGPVIAFLTSVRSTSGEFGILLSSFTTALRKISADPRTFASSINYNNVTGEIKFKLLGKIDEKKEQPSELLRAYRSYLAKHLSGTQCADGLIVGTEEKPHPAISFANTLLKIPLTEEEIKPEKIEPRAKIFSYWRTPKAAKLLTNIKKLRFGNSSVELTQAERSSQEWQESLMRYLEQMVDWKPEDEETEADYLHQKNVLYDGLAQMAPDALRGLVLRDYALFLRDSRMQKESPIQWLYYVKRLLRTGKTLKGKEYDDFVHTLNGNGNQVFPLYLDLESLQLSKVH